MRLRSLAAGLALCVAWLAFAYHDLARMADKGRALAESRVTPVLRSAPPVPAQWGRVR